MSISIPTVEWKEMDRPVFSVHELTDIYENFLVKYVTKGIVCLELQNL